MIHIHIEAENALDLRKQLQELLGDEPLPYVKVDIPAALTDEPSLPYFVNASPNRGALQQGEWEVPDQPAEITTDETGAPKFRKYEPVAESESEAPVAQPEPEPEPAEPCPKMEECRAALNALRAKHGPGAVRVILTNHGVKSFVELDATDYAKVMREAENYGN